MVRAHGHLKNEEATAGAWEAGRGAVIGASKVRTRTLYPQLKDRMSEY